MMIPLYSAQDLVDAQLLVDKLRDFGVEATIRNGDLQGAIGELPWSVRPEVCLLDPADVPWAVAIKKEYEQARSQPVTGKERVCSACGELSPPNFEVCWKCRQPFR